MTERLAYRKHAAGGMKAIHGIVTYLDDCGLSPTLIELVNLRVSQINGCAYCLDMHTRALLKSGVPVEKLALVQAWREGGPLFDARERAALAWAETVTRVAETGVPDADYAAARAVFDEGDLANLTVAIGLINVYNRLAISFRSTPEAAKG
jgi:AhpD family alkylhydroperoxidase